jgi:Mn-dependent DtxR family transcriptional regulator
MQPSKPLPALTSAMEDYLEAIYHLEKERRIARVRDIANRLGVKMSSVTSALKSLGGRGLIQYDPHQFITLTEAWDKKGQGNSSETRDLETFPGEGAPGGRSEVGGQRLSHRASP